MKCLLLGLDGATWNLLKKWANEGELPTIKKLIDKGISSSLESTIPSLTPPAWTSMFTGVNPGKHNIFDFVINEGYGKKYLTSLERKTKCIWEILTNKKMIVLNVPQTYPPDAVNGIMVSGMGTPSLKSNFTYPPNIKESLLKSGYDLEIGISDVPKEVYIDKIIESDAKLLTIASNLINNNEWDLSICVLIGSDRLQHFFWHFMDSTHPCHQKNTNKKLKSAILDYYKTVDEKLNELISSNNYSEETNVLIVSDHGFGPTYYDVSINNWLNEIGLLKFKNPKKYKRMIQNLISIEKLSHILQILGIKSLVSKLPEKLFCKIKEAIPSEQHLNKQMIREIDWPNTKAWFASLSGQSILINLKGRQPQGIVTKKEYCQLISHLKKEMCNLKHNDQLIVEKVYTKDELYEGDYLFNADDLYIKMKDGYVLQEGLNDNLISRPKFGSAIRSGDHRLHGIFLAHGPDIKQGANIEGARIIDLAPTILHMYGVPIPRDIDGRVLTEIFREDSEMAQREIVYEEDKTKAEKNKDALKNKIGKLKTKRKI